MKNPSVTVVLAGNTYTLRSDDPNSLRNIPTSDRDQLIALLEALKEQRGKSDRLVQDALAKRIVDRSTIQNGGGALQNEAPKERLGKGDVDAIMARLIMEEKQQRKPGMKPATIYKIAAAIVVVIFLMSIF